MTVKRTTYTVVLIKFKSAFQFLKNVWDTEIDMLVIPTNFISTFR